jgi:hypothetical protein
MFEKKYSLHMVESNEGEIFHCVFEEKTQQVIDFFYFLDDAIETAQFMETGGAFDGYTPGFMLKEINIPVDNNEKIQSIF